MLSRLSSRYISLGVVIISILAAVAWYFLLYQPAQASVQVLQDEIIKKQDEKAIGERARTNIAQVCGIVSNLRVQQTAFLKALPRTEDISALLNELRFTILNNGAQLNSISKGAGAVLANNAPLPAGVRSIGISMAVEGTFPSFYGVLAALEALQRFSKVETVALGATGENSNPNLNAQLSLTTYVYDNPSRDNTQVLAENQLCQSASTTSGVPR